MTENVRKIFDILGVEPNEEFEILLGDSTKFRYKCKIGERLQGYYFYGEDWIFFDDLLCDLLNGTNTIIKIPKKKHVGDLKCEEFHKCENCPFKYLSCGNKGNTLYEILGLWLNRSNDKEIYTILKTRLDKEVEK